MPRLPAIEGKFPRRSRRTVPCHRPNSAAKWTPEGHATKRGPRRSLAESGRTVTSLKPGGDVMMHVTMRARAGEWGSRRAEGRCVGTLVGPGVGPLQLPRSRATLTRPGAACWRTHTAGTFGVSFSIRWAVCTGLVSCLCRCSMFIFIGFSVFMETLSSPLLARCFNMHTAWRTAGVPSLNAAQRWHI